MSFLLSSPHRKMIPKQFDCICHHALDQKIKKRERKKEIKNTGASHYPFMEGLVNFRRLNL